MFYAVAKGRKIGIFNNWSECQASVSKFKGAIFKKFATVDECERFIKSHQTGTSESTDVVLNTKNMTNTTVSNAEHMKSLETSLLNDGFIIGYVDGSYNKNTKCAGYGLYVKYPNGFEQSYNGMVNSQDVSARNVVGELYGAYSFIRHYSTVSNKLALVYDYECIYKFVSGDYIPKSSIAIAYVNSLKNVDLSEHHLRFFDVKGHTCVVGNDMADRLAKASVGIK